MGGKNTERWVLCVRFSRALLWLLVRATGKARDLLEAVTRLRETVPAGIRGWCESWEKETGRSIYVEEGHSRACRSVCFLKERRVTGGSEVFV